MNKSHLISLLHQPETATAADTAALREITHTYPYFQAARVLFAKCLHLQHSYLFEKELKTTALHAGSRSKLYHYIHSKPVEISVQENETDADEHLTRELHSNQQPLTEISAGSAFPQIVAPAIEETPLNPIDKEVTDKIIHEVSIESEIEQEVKQETETVSKITTDIVNTAISTIPEQTETTTDTDNTSVSRNELASAHSFDEWLNLLTEHHLPEIIAAEQPSVPDTKNEVITAEYSIHSTGEQVPLLNQQPEHKTSTFDPHSIIERFIADSPSISRPKAEFFNPVNMAKMSVEEDEDLVTETLARINAKQGNYKKAIRMYEKLCLKFPEKMPYFVDLIQKIKSDYKLD